MTKHLSQSLDSALHTCTLLPCTHTLPPPPPPRSHRPLKARQTKGRHVLLLSLHSTAPLRVAVGCLTHPVPWPTLTFTHCLETFHPLAPSPAPPLSSLHDLMFRFEFAPHITVELPVCKREERAFALLPEPYRCACVRVTLDWLGSPRLTHKHLYTNISLSRYETHPNQYLPHYQIGSETETEDERSKLLNSLDNPYSASYQPQPISQLPEDRHGVTYSPYRVRSNRRHDTVKRFSEFGGDMSVISGVDDEEEGASLWGGAASNTSASDLDNVCDIEDSEVNSEFEIENDDKVNKR